MPRYLLTYRPGSVPPASDLASLDDHPDVRVIDRAGRTVYVESSEEALSQLASSLPDWTLAPERIVKLPDSEKRLRKKPASD